MRYEGDVYRPPSEAHSLIIQMTIGCARNDCTFCSMYKAKNFRIRKLDEIFADLDEVAALYGPNIRRVFLADGDALICKTSDLLAVMNHIHEVYPNIERITSYGAPRDVLLKTDDELKALRAAGLEIVYMGAESGDDEILSHVEKNATRNEIIEAGLKLKRCGIDASVTLISGLGGKARLREHALESASLITAMKPKYVGFLTLMLVPGTPMYEEVERGELELLSASDVMDELEIFLDNVDSEGTVFRANHASNYVPLRGTLNKDTAAMLASIRSAKQNRAYRPDWYRGL